jgi:hypothetical protein
MRHGWLVLALLVLPPMCHATSIVTTSSIDLTCAPQILDARRTNPVAEPSPSCGVIEPLQSTTINHSEAE